MITQIVPLIDLIGGRDYFRNADEIEGSGRQNREIGWNGNESGKSIW